MKKKRFLFLSIAIAAFIIQFIDIISYTIKFSITETFILVMIQMIGLLGYAYGARNIVKNQHKMLKTIHIAAFIIYLINLYYQLFFSPSLRRSINTVNLVPFKTILLYFNAYKMHSLPLKNIFLNIVGNMMLFMPYGYFMYVLFKRFRSFIPYVFLFLSLICGVEIIQYIAKVGTADIDDVILNMSGIVIFYIMTLIPWLRKRIKHMEK